MAKHTSYKDKLREAEFKKKIFDSLNAARQQGLLQGTRAMLQVIGNMISEKNDKTAEEKLAEVMRFINTSLAMTDKTVEEADEKVKETRKPIEELGKDEDKEPAEEEPKEEPLVQLGEAVKA